MEGFLLTLKWEDLLLIWIFEVGRHIFNLNLELGIFTFDPALIWPVPADGRLYKEEHGGNEKGSWVQKTEKPSVTT